MQPQERIRIRDLAKRTLEFAQSDVMNARRQLWSDHNSFRFTKPPVYIRVVPIEEFLEPGELQCTDPYLRGLERQFLVNEYRRQLADDTIIEPWLTVRAVLKSSPEGLYGVRAELGHKPAAGGAAAYQPSIVAEQDLERIQVADYEVDEQETAVRFDRLADLVGDILPVVVDRQGLLCPIWSLDISTLLGKLVGLEQLMWDVYDRPEWLHRLMARMQAGVLRNIEQTEAAGGFAWFNHENQAMSYSRDLPPPSIGGEPVKVNQLWGYMAAQEFTGMGPEMFEAFIFHYQMPILERFGLTAYGCCEDLTQKIPVLRKLRNLRRIGVAPAANRVRCAEQIGGDYVLAWRPDPSSHVSHGLDESFIRAEMRSAFDTFAANGCRFDITLKDVETVSGDRTAIIRWARIVREEIERRYG